MSINQIMSTSTSALLSSQNQIAVSSNNISNADKAGYTRKTYETDSISSGAGTTFGKGELQRASNDVLSRSVNGQASQRGRDKVINDYMIYYDSLTGTTDGANLSGRLADLQAAYNELAASPDADSAKNQVIRDAGSLSSDVNDLSRNIQSLRTETDQQIVEVVDQINARLDDLDRLNDEIVSLSASGAEVANLVDEQDRQIEELSQLIGIQYFRDADGRATIYTEGGGLLLGTQANHLDYQGAGRLTEDETYPADISGIMLNGNDVTGKVRQGELGGLLDLRDGILAGEQEKLDAFAGTLVDESNKISNRGSAYPPPDKLTSDAGHAPADPFSGTGTLDVAVVSSQGMTQSAQSIDLTTLGSMNDLVAALDGMAGMSASLSADGRLVLSADTPDTGLVLSGTGTEVNGSGREFSHYFGFNDLFKGDDAASMRVNDSLLADPSALPTASFQAGTGMTAGGRALSVSDGSVASDMVDLFDRDLSFGATSTTSARTASLNDYGRFIVSDAATTVARAEDDYAASEEGYSYVKNLLANDTGVNIDEETALLTQYQNLYEANARLIAVAQEMYDILFNMVD